VYALTCIYINDLRASYCENRSHLAHKLAVNENQFYPRQYISMRLWYLAATRNACRCPEQHRCGRI